MDNILPHVAVRQWVLSFPIPLRGLFAVHPDLIPLVLQIIHRAITTFLIQQTDIKRSEAATGAITLQRFGSAANLNTHLHALALDGVYSTAGEGAPVFQQAPAPSPEQLQVLLDKIINRIVRLLTRLGYLVEEEGITYMARTDSIDPDNVLAPLQAASSTWRIAMGPRAGRKVLSLQNTSPVGWVKPITTHRANPAKLCANGHGFSLHAGVRRDADDRKGIEQLCRYITRPAISNERLSINREGNAVLKLKTPWRNGATHIVLTPMEFMQRLAALVARPRLHLIRFHGVLPHLLLQVHRAQHVCPVCPAQVPAPVFLLYGPRLRFDPCACADLVSATDAGLSE